MRPSRATRGAVLLVGLAGTLVFGVLSVTGVLLAWSALVPLMLAVGGFAWLRAGVQAEIRARQEARREADRTVHRTTQRRTATDARVVVDRGGSIAPSRRPAAVAESDIAVEGPAVSGEVRRDEEHLPAPEAEPFDVSVGIASEIVAESAEPETVEAEPVVAARAAEVTPALPEVDEDDIPLTWDPRPVPPPTYTMKARAPERPVPTAEVEPHAEAEETAYDELPERRISGL